MKTAVAIASFLLSIVVGAWLFMLGLGALHSDLHAVPALGFGASFGAMLALSSVATVWHLSDKP